VETLKLYITQGGIAVDKLAVRLRGLIPSIFGHNQNLTFFSGFRHSPILQKESQMITIKATGAISWRKEGIKYKKNECFIDVIETLNLLMSNKAAILRADCAGSVMMKSYLSGMPECKFGLNDKVLMERSSRKT